jgi:LuxR family transcriptional regulator, quorum-sensing system regulator SolR
MRKIILPQDYISYAYSENLRELCQPLFKNTNIDLFRYVRLYRNGNCIILSTDLAFEKFILLRHEGKFNFDVRILNAMFNNKQLSKKTNRMCAFTEEVDKIGYWDDLWKEFNIVSCLNIVDKFDKYYERFGFLSRRGKNFYNFYVNHYNILEKFICYFREKSKDLIRNAEKNNFVWLNNHPSYSILLKDFEQKAVKESCDIVSLKNNFNLKKYSISNGDVNIFITSCELKCLRYFGLGFTYKEIGDILQLSSRTIETHMQHIKDKMGACSSSQLLKIYHSSSLMDLN